MISWRGTDTHFVSWGWTLRPSQIWSNGPGGLFPIEREGSTKKSG
jgi:hypothetical protein